MKYTAGSNIDQQEVGFVVHQPEEVKKDKALLEKLIALQIQLFYASDSYDHVYGLRTRKYTAKEDRDTATRLILQSQIYVVMLGDEIAGMCRVMPAEHLDTIYVGGLVIDERYRGQHLGRRLLEHVIKTNSTKNCELGVMLSNKVGLALYESLGFKPISCFMVRKKGNLT